MRSKTLIIAEAGVNHNGDMDIARRLIDVAASSGADFIKFQTFKAEKISSPEAAVAQYQAKNMQGKSKTQFEMLRKLEISEPMHLELMNYCQSKNISFFSTAFDIEGLHFLNSIGLDLFKIPSGEITHLPYLETVAGFRKRTILSTGMANLGEIENALQVLTSNGLHYEDITVLHCNSQYPTPHEDVNLNAMRAIKEAFGVAVGYSDHTIGIEIPVASVALGASVVEKHFTLSRNMEGPDHKASLEPNELSDMIKAIRNVELALSGHGRKEPSQSELPNKQIVRKSIYLATNLNQGDIISENNLIALRPGDGISPMFWHDVVGRKIKKDQKAGTKLKWSDLD